MKTIEIKIKEKELIREINNDTTLLDSALKYVKKLKRANQQKYPCQFTENEQEDILLKGEQDAKKGLGITHENLEEKFASW
ncbi:MAG: hypothetical protein LBN74_10540 [Prevotella sp.]|nr:hypothetical protein [Prevotella sp.]